jgi:hypothetical protein
MNRDLAELRRNLQAVCPTLSADDLALIIECLGYELLGRAIWQGVKLVDVSRDLLGWTPPGTRRPIPLPGLPLRQPA